MTFEPIDVQGREYMIRDSAQTRDAKTSSAKLLAQTQIEHGCVIGKIFQADIANDAQGVMAKPECFILLIAKNARTDDFHCLSNSPRLGVNVEREVVAGEEFDEAGTIGTVGIEA